MSGEDSMLTGMTVRITLLAWTRTAVLLGYCFRHMLA